MESIKCIICKSNRNNLYNKVNDRFQVSKTYTIVKCECGFVFLNPRPSINEISKNYNLNTKYLPHNSDKKTIFNILYRFAQRITFLLKKRLIKTYTDKNKNNLLDIGSGDGRFLNYLATKTNLNIYSNDPYFDSGFSSSTDSSDNFDIITLWHSLEHIHNIDETFDIIKDKLDLNGILIVAVPNIDAYEKKFFKNNWVAYDAPRHLYHFSPATIAKLFSNYEFNIIKKHTMYQDTLFNIASSLKPFNFLKFISFSIVSIFNIFFNQTNSSSIIYICKRN